MLNKCNRSTIYYSSKFGLDLVISWNIVKFDNKKKILYKFTTTVGYNYVIIRRQANKANRLCIQLFLSHSFVFSPHPGSSPILLFVFHVYFNNAISLNLTRVAHKPLVNILKECTHSMLLTRLYDIFVYTQNMYLLNINTLF